MGMETGGRTIRGGLRGARGICLMELLCALGIGMVVIAWSFEAVSRLEARFRIQQRDMARMQDARIGLAVWEQDIRAMVNENGMAWASLGRATESEVAFQANVNSMATSLIAAAAAGETVLAVRDGSGWPEGKRVRLCHSSGCVERRLARTGQQSRLVLTLPLEDTIPAGTEILVINDVRYYVVEGQAGHFKLMRQVDGGSNTLIGDLEGARFHYRTREGQLTEDPRLIASVGIDLAISGMRHPLSQLVAIRV